MKYKGYEAVVKYSDEDETFIGEVINTRDMLIFDGNDVAEGEQSFHAVIDEYLADKDAPILILDEATSALDSESERAIQIALKEVMKGRTTLVIAHRLSTIENADQVIVLGAGQGIEQGTHAQLLERGEAYARLYHTQFEIQGRAAD